VNPVVSVIVSALERTAQLIEKGMPAAKALKQASADLQDYAEKNSNQRIPERVFDLGERKAA
jgi:hypothetical protein